MHRPHLVVTPSVPVWKDNEHLVFDRKFYDGISLYKKMWPGDVSCIMSLSKSNPPDFGFMKKKHHELPFGCTVLGENEPISSGHLENASIVLASADSFNQLHVSKLCREANTKCIYVIEYIPETRYQIVALSTRNPLIRFRRFFYVWNMERKRTAAFSLSDGLQSNGTAALNEYRNVSNNLLYFDTRVNKELIIREDELQRKLSTLSEHKPLRLAFSGRLIRTKGADHLIEVARILKKRDINFHLTIYGTGDLENTMKELIERYQLNNHVLMTGAVDFYGKLLPDLKQNVDLFLILHRQSDPSCTYLETLSCGVPIVGYDNRAFSGLLEQADIGWGVKMNDLDAVVKIIEELNTNRKIIAEKAINSMNFTHHHDFETTFQKRIDHLYQLVK